MNTLIVLTSVLLLVAIFIAWLLIVGRKSFNETATSSRNVIKSSIKSSAKPILIFLGVATLLIASGAAVWHFSEMEQQNAKWERTQKQKRLDESKYNALKIQVSQLTDEEADKYDICWESGRWGVSHELGWHSEGINQFKMEKCLSEATTRDLLGMQEWYKTYRKSEPECRLNFNPTYGYLVPDTRDCHKKLIDTAKANRWPINYFGCGYSTGTGISFTSIDCKGRTDRKMGELPSTAPIDRKKHLYLYEQEWAKPLLDCFARSVYRKGEMKPSGRQIPERWTQRGESCEFSYDLLEKTAREADWPMGEGSKHFPVSHYKPSENK